jgi:hypothetical protein
MKRCALILAVISLSPWTSPAQAQVTLGSLDRTISGRIDYGTGVVTQTLDNFADPGLYNHDLLLDEGGFLVSGNHNTSIEASASNLAVDGALTVAVSATDGSATVYQEAATFVIVNFQVSEPSTALLDVTLAGGGEVFFFDLTANDYAFDHASPGNYTLEAALVPAHVYLFQVNVIASRYAGLQSAESSAALSLLVAPTAVGNEAAAWGAIKALYR